MRGPGPFVVGVAVVVLAACGRHPTAPSAVRPTEALSGESGGGHVTPAIAFNPPRAVGATRFVAFGDSITFGTLSSFVTADLAFAAANGGYPERLQVMLAAAHSPQQFLVVNDGLPGEAVSGALTRFRAMLTSRRPEVVLLLEGINDLSGDVAPGLVASRLFQLVDSAATSGVPVIVATMFQTYAVVNPSGQPRPNGAAAVPAFNAEVRRLAVGRLNVHVLDLEPQMRDRALVGNDGLHLTDAGFEVMARAFQQRIAAVFGVRGSFQ